MTDIDYPAPIRKQFNQTFWDGIENGDLLIQECASCGATRYPPTSHCPSCAGDLEWVEADGDGTVYSAGVVHRPNQPEVFADSTPISIAIVELPEGPRIVSNVVNCDPADVEIGDKMTVVFEDMTDEVTLPKFEPVE
jgi:uncharacterized OB-fold protein